MRHRAKVCWLVFALIAASKVAAADTLTLMWDMSADSRVVGYRVYAGTQSGVYTTNSDVGNTTSFVLSNAVPGQRYYFAASAYAADGVESSLSAEISGFGNTPPALTNPGNQTSGVGKAITLQLVGADPYGEPVSYKATGLPAGLSLTPSTGLITGAPVSAGTNTVTATVTDGVLSNSQTFTWSIAAPTTPPIVNLPPVLTNPGNQTSVVGKAITLQLVGSDPEKQPISYLAGGLPAGLTVTASTGLITGVPLTVGTNTVTAAVFDGKSVSSTIFTWSISSYSN